MKKIFSNTGLILGLLILLTFNSCKKTIDPVVSDLTFTSAFTPVDFSAQISNITTVTLSWVTVKNVDHYVVEIYQDTDFTTENLVYTSNVDGAETYFVYAQPAGDTQFSARLNAISSLEVVAESKWISVVFKSLPENLFLGYISELSGIGTCTVRWKPGSTATSLSLSLIHISEPTRLGMISYAVFCLKK